MRCADVQKLVHPYLDGEFEDSELDPLERHLTQCDACRKLVAFEQAFKTNLRARLRRPTAPPELRDRVVAALDRADATGGGPVPALWRRAMPVAAAAAVAAAALVFLSTAIRTRADGSPIVEDAIRGHEKSLPIEVQGDADSVKVWMHGKVPVPVRPPRLPADEAVLVGARLGHVRDRDAAQIVYRVGQSNVTVYVFDASGMAMDAPRKRIVGSRELFVGGARGYNVVFYRDRGVGYAFTSDLAEDDMLRLVSTAFDE